MGKVYKTPKHDYVYRENPCPKCGQRVILIPPDTVWCENEKCNHSELHIVGRGIIDEYLQQKNSKLFESRSEVD